MLKTQLKERLYFIGDVHARYGKLIDLLNLIDFASDNPKSSAATGQLVFVGDLIDNAPECMGEHLVLLNLVESLVKREQAFCLLGNHEFNAIGWATQKEDGQWARPHTDNNRAQHRGFLDAVGEGSQTHQRWITWFKSLPLFIDFESVKAIHACWDAQAITRIKPYLNADNSLKEAHWVDAFDKSHELFALCEILLKGPEQALPEGQYFLDKTGKKRNQKRIEWWKDSAYPESLVPVVIGHHTLGVTPKALSRKVVCVDYNAATGDNPLVCCQFDLVGDDKRDFSNGALFHYQQQCQQQ